MTFWEVAGLIVGTILTIGALTGSLRDLARLPREMWRTFGWHGRFWKSLVGLVAAIDRLLAIPDRIDAIDERSKNTEAQVALILGEVKNNGGTSSKDSLHRIERVLGLPDPPYTPVPAGTGPIPTASHEESA